MHMKLPPSIIAFTDTVRAANAFLAMMMIGIGFELHLDRKHLLRIGGVLINRYIIAVVIVWICYNYAPAMLKSARYWC